MVFNEGRFAAYEGHYQRVSAFPSAVATASGTGHTGADLVIHALAAGEPGLSVENPRQVPAYRYSERYGPRPPCFARATLLPGGGSSPVRLLVGGTASILGEESRHLDCLETQLEETLRNLDALIGAGQSLVRSAAPRRGGGLSCFREIRVYHPERVPRELLLARINASFASAESVEFVTSDLCRPELMVEIEGLAEI
jgi:chorismate lyase/3-hydroxybenzoate synthase